MDNLLFGPRRPIKKTYPPVELARLSTEQRQFIHNPTPERAKLLLDLLDRCKELIATASGQAALRAVAGYLDQIIDGLVNSTDDAPELTAVEGLALRGYRLSPTGFVGFLKRSSDYRIGWSIYSKLTELNEQGICLGTVLCIGSGAGQNHYIAGPHWRRHRPGALCSTEAKTSNHRITKASEVQCRHCQRLIKTGKRRHVFSSKLVPSKELIASESNSLDEDKLQQITSVTELHQHQRIQAMARVTDIIADLFVSAYDPKINQPDQLDRQQLAWLLERFFDSTQPDKRKAATALRRLLNEYNSMETIDDGINFDQGKFRS